MRRTVATLILVLVTLGASWLAIASQAPPEPVPASAPADAFSAERAMAHVEALATRPRPVGSEAHAAARQYVVDQLADLGLEPEVWTGVGRSGSGTILGTAHDVIARVDADRTDRGETGGGTVLLMTHYDSVAASPGASDDAVGVAVLLETLRALLAGPAPRNDVLALVTDGEELGLLGAEAFAEGHPLADEVDVVLNFEARGTRGPSIMFETGPGNAELIARYADVAPYPFAASYSYEVYRRLPNDTDFTVFKERGLPGLNFAHIHGAVGYHTALDSIEHLDPASLQHHGSNALALARSAAAEPVADLAAAGGDAVYFNPFGHTFVHFPAGWVIALLALLGVATVGVLAAGVARGRIGVVRLVLGVVCQVVVVAILAGLGIALRGVLFPVFYDFRIWGDASSVAFTLFGLALVALGLAAGLQRLAGRFVPAPDLAASGLLLWLLVTAAVSVAAPGASYLFILPLLVQLVAVGGAFGRSTEEDEGVREARIGAVSFGLLTAAAVVTGVVWAPTLSLLAVGLGMGAGAIVTALVGLLAALLAPQIDLTTAGPLRWIGPVVPVAAGAGLILAVHLSAGFGPDNPRPSTLFYALDAGSGEAVWATFETAPGQRTERTAAVLPEAPEVGPLPEILGWSRPVATGPAPALGLPAPEAWRLGAPDGGDDGDVVRLRIVPPEGTARLRLLLEPASAVDGVTVEGRSAEPRPLDGVGAGEGEGDADRSMLLYVAPPADGIEMEITTSDPAAVTLAAVAQSWGLPAHGDGGPEPRGPAEMQSGWFWDSDTTMVRRSWSLDALPSAPEAGPEADGGAEAEPLAAPASGTVE